MRFLQRRLICLGKFDNAGIALFGLLGERAQEDGVQFGRERWHIDAGRRGRRVMMVVQQLARRSLEDGAARHQLIEHDCQGVLIRRRADVNGCRQRGIVELLRSHVQRRADRAMQRAPIAIEGGQTEIGQQQVWAPLRKYFIERGVLFRFGKGALDADQEVGGLDIAMDDAVIMGALQGGRGLRQIVTSLFSANRPVEAVMLRAFLQPAPQGTFGKIGHDQVGDGRFAAFNGLFTKVIERQYMLMFQFGDGPRLALEAQCCLPAFRRIRNGAQVAANDFDRHFASDARMLGKINITHTTSLDESHEAIPAESFPHQHIHCLNPSSGIAFL